MDRRRPARLAPLTVRVSFGSSLGYSIRALRRHPRRDRQHAARRHAPHVPEARRSAVGQARGQQPHRLHEGPHRQEDGRGRRGLGRAHRRPRRSWSRRPATPASRSPWSPRARGTSSPSSSPTTRVRSASGCSACSAPRSCSARATRGRTARSRSRGGWRRTRSTSCRSSTETPANPLAHYEGTAAEILADLPTITHFVAGMGTGGTLTGNGRRLHEHDPNIQVIAAEPELGDLVYGLRSLDEGFVPPIFDPTRSNRKFLVNSVRRAPHEPGPHGEGGHLRGISSGAVVHVALRIAAELGRGRHRVPAPRRRLEVPVDRGLGRGHRDGREGRRGVVVVVTRA